MQAQNQRFFFIGTHSGVSAKYTETETSRKDGNSPYIAQDVRSVGGSSGRFKLWRARCQVGNESSRLP